jgi:hypothetical protein
LENQTEKEGFRILNSSFRMLTVLILSNWGTGQLWLPKYKKTIELYYVRACLHMNGQAIKKCSLSDWF